jgi:predicted dehydrogenase
MTYCVNFDGATVDYDLARTPDPLRVAEEGKPAVIVRCEGPDGYIGELTHFIESIRAGKPPSVVTVDDAVAAVDICTAEERSVLTGSAEKP